MNTQDAAYATVHDYPGGASSLAPRMGMPVAVLNSKVNPNTHTHHLSLSEAVRVMAVTGDTRMLRAQCDELGFLPPIPRVVVDVSDMALLESYTQMISRLGEFSRQFHAALSDGRLTTAEVDQLENGMLDFFAAGEELVNRARSIAR